MTLKGLIAIDGEVIFTCCERRPNITIDGTSLHEWLRQNMDDSGVPSYEEGDPDHERKEWAIRYCVQDSEFLQSSFDDAAADTLAAMLYSEHVKGCYSEWTCGTGNIDFVLNGNHSILQELASFEGKHVWISFGGNAA